MAHNYYQQPGGEDQSFAAEARMLEAWGHAVTRYTAHNDQINGMKSLKLVQKTLWNSDTYGALRNIFSKDTYQVAHFQNTFPLISPSAYYAARDASVPVVQSLRNYRLMCVNSLFFRDGGVCEDCMSKIIPWPGVAHACYRDSHAASGVIASMLSYHRLRHTYSEMVDVYIALTEFSRTKFVEAGLPAEKIMVKPNFVNPDPGAGSGRGGYVLFVGRLSKEKGLDTLLAAWRKLGVRLPLKIVGDGPLVPEVWEAAEKLEGLEWLGRKLPAEVYDLMGKAAFLIFPSQWYEGMPRTIIESFAKGTPVLASNLGAMSSMIEHGRTGLHFRPGDPDDLAAQVAWALSHPAELARMREEAREEFEAKYTAERNYKMLIEIYEEAMG